MTFPAAGHAGESGHRNARKRHQSLPVQAITTLDGMVCPYVPFLWGRLNANTLSLPEHDRGDRRSMQRPDAHHDALRQSGFIQVHGQACALVAFVAQQLGNCRSYGLLLGFRKLKDVTSLPGWGCPGHRAGSGGSCQCGRRRCARAPGWPPDTRSPPAAAACAASAPCIPILRRHPLTAQAPSLQLGDAPLQRDCLPMSHKRKLCFDCSRHSPQPEHKCFQACIRVRTCPTKGAQ